MYVTFLSSSSILHTSDDNNIVGAILTLCACTSIYVRAVCMCMCNMWTYGVKHCCSK